MSSTEVETLCLALSVVSLSVQGCPFLDHSKTVMEGGGVGGGGSVLSHLTFNAVLRSRFVLKINVAGEEAAGRDIR